MSIPDEEVVTWRFPKHGGPVLEFGYPYSVWWHWSSAALGPCSPPPSPLTPPANSATRAACGPTSTPRCCCWLTPTTTHIYDFLEAVTGTGASVLLRSTRKRRPAMRRPLPDGSYLTTVCAGRYRAGRGYGRLEVRIIEAWMTIELADGTRRIR